MNTILGELGKNFKFCELIKNIENKKGPISISGLSDVGKTQIISGIHQFIKKPICLITYNEIQAQKLVNDLKYFSDNVVFLPKKEIVTYDYIAESKDLPYERIEALNKIYEDKNIILVTTIEAVMQKIITKKSLYKNIIKLKIGDEFDQEVLKQNLVNLGYTRTELLEGNGQFSIRGDIVDISLNNNTGVRIEFWGDEVDSIRYFNITTQRSTENLQKVSIYPTHEYVLDDDIDAVCNKIETLITDKTQENIKQDIELIKSGNYISKIDKYFNCFYSESETILDYLSNKYLIALDEENKISQRVNNIEKDIENIIKVLVEKNKLIPEAINNILTYLEIGEKLQEKELVYIEKQDITVKKQVEKYNFNYREVNYFKSEISRLFEELQKAQAEKKHIYVLTSTKEKAKKLVELLDNEEIINRYEEKLNQTIVAKNNESIVVVSVGKLSTGFENFEINQLVIVAEDLVEGEKKKRRHTSNEFRQGQKVVFADLEIGDYVVHKYHGIGVFVGVNTITTDKVTKDYIKIKYKGNDILYIPTNQLDSIRKYIGGGESIPKINKMGGKDWSNTKAKVKNNLREVAKELIELYAKREKVKGFAFSQDVPWQTQFEDTFPYIETDDQLRCIEEIKKDMEKEKPMDRLLCGDVGYGKTEVAIRAAFKAVMDQKQVAYLVPTTVLADQQYQSFKERIGEFPVRVEVLNRFKTSKEQKEIIKKLKLGEIDIVIGTHRLLSKDVEFKDLGLKIKRKLNNIKPILMF